MKNLTKEQKTNLAKVFQALSKCSAIDNTKLFSQMLFDYANETGLMNCDGDIQAIDDFVINNESLEKLDEIIEAYEEQFEAIDDDAINDDREYFEVSNNERDN